jgi:hypothetical protein
MERWLMSVNIFFFHFASKHYFISKTFRCFWRTLYKGLTYERLQFSFLHSLLNREYKLSTEVGAPLYVSNCEMCTESCRLHVCMWNILLRHAEKLLCENNNRSMRFAYHDCFYLNVSLKCRATWCW